MVTTTLQRYASSVVEADDLIHWPTLLGLGPVVAPRACSGPGRGRSRATSTTKRRKVPSNPEVLGSSRSWSPAQAAPAVLLLRRCVGREHEDVPAVALVHVHLEHLALRAFAPLLLEALRQPGESPESCHTNSRYRTAAASPWHAGGLAGRVPGGRRRACGRRTRRCRSMRASAASSRAIGATDLREHLLALVGAPRRATFL